MHFVNDRNRFINIVRHFGEWRREEGQGGLFFELKKKEFFSHIN